MKRDPIYGMMAEFETAQALVDAAHKTHQAGYKKIDAWQKKLGSITTRFRLSS
jgi:hypothetical protein